MTESVGSLALICGPMWAGKSTELLRRVRRHSVTHGKVAVITHAKDVRFGPEMALATHDAAIFHAIAAKHLGDEEVVRAVAMSDVVAVDEGQFFDDLAPMCNKWADAGKIVIVSALDATFERKPFANVTELCPDTVDKLTAVCFHCKRDAPFTRRTSGETAVEVVGAKDKYEAVCRACYVEKRQVD